MIVLRAKGPWYDLVKEGGGALASAWKQCFTGQPEADLCPGHTAVFEPLRWFIRDIALGGGESSALPPAQLADILGNPVGDTITCEAEELVHAQLRWAQTGYPTFDLTHSLEAQLLLTDTDGVAAEDVVWPFDHFVIATSGEGMRVSELSAERRPDAVRWILVSRIQGISEAHHDLVCARLDKLARSRSLWDSDYWPAFRRVMDGVPTRPSLLVRAITESGIGVFRRSPEPTGRTPLAAWAQGYGGGSRSASTTDADEASLRNAYRIASGLALYLQGLAAEGKWSAKEPRRTDRRTGEEKPLRWQVGREIKLPRELREAAQEFARRGSSAASRATWKLRSRTFVRGYGKMQHYGPKDPTTGKCTMRKPILVAPYVKGPDGAPVIPKNYVVDVHHRK